MKIKKLIYYYHLICTSHLGFAIYSNNVFYIYSKKIQLESHIAVSCYVSLVFFNMKQFLNLSLTLMTFGDYKPVILKSLP